MMILARLDASDRALFLRLAMIESASRRARVFWRGLTHLGSAPATIAAAVLPMAAAGTIAQASRHAFLTLILSHILVQLVKRTVGRPRPSSACARKSLAAVPDQFSFPSGHSAAAMSIAIAYAAAFPELGSVLIPVAALVGASRVFLGVHYPGDVLMGQFLAVLVGAIVIH
jgi:undecaprenyl-diphosphatase